MSFRRFPPTVFVLSLLFFASPSQGADPATVEAAVGAADAAPGMLKALRSVARIPLDTAKVMRLPLGVVEVALCPLPGLTARQGLTDIGKGIVAPIELTITVLEVPYHVLGGLEQAAVALVE